MILLQLSLCIAKPIGLIMRWPLESCLFSKVFRSPYRKRQVYWISIEPQTHLFITELLMVMALQSFYSTLAELRSWLLVRLDTSKKFTWYIFHGWPCSFLTSKRDCFHPTLVGTWYSPIVIRHTCYWFAFVFLSFIFIAS